MPHQESDTNPFRLEQTFDDFEVLAESARAWDLDFRQVGRGAFRGRLHQIADAGAAIAYARFERSLDQRGAAPPGMRTFVVPASADLKLHWRGHRIRGNDLMLFPRNGELQSLSGPDFAVDTISLSDGHLEQAAASLGNARVLASLATREVFSAPTAAMDRVRAAVRRAQRFWSWETIQRVAVEILATVVASRTPRAHPRADVLDRARAFGPVTNVAELAEGMGVHERTLQRAFSEFDEVTPKSYLLALSLNAVRRALLRDEDVSIGEVARRHGFWHMGQFAADYRRLFGELPSDSARAQTHVAIER